MMMIDLLPSKSSIYVLSLLAAAVNGEPTVTTTFDHIRPNNNNNNHNNHNDNASSPFKIVIDGGSTGSRLHIFEFVENNDDSDTTECVRRGSKRANVPLSAYGRLEADKDKPLNATYVAEHLLPLFEYAGEVIPPQYHHSTAVTYQATAGMRLLDESEQEEVYDALYEGLMEADSFVFQNMNREDIATLSGELEGYYGAVAANYLQGLIDAELNIRNQANGDASSSSSSEGPIGALDMGGSSTQIVFLPQQHINNEDEDEDSSSDATTCTNDDSGDGSCHVALHKQPLTLQEDDFFSTSYLSYGVDQFRERLWDTLIAERKYVVEQEDEESCASKFIFNPCSFKGHSIEWKGFTLTGTGNTEQCVKQVKRLIPYADKPLDDNHETETDFIGRVGGIEHPPVQGKFFAMSLYFFTLDSLRELSKANPTAHEALNKSWPNPSIEELAAALDGLCSRELQDLQEDFHQYTRAAVLPHRCIESVYLVTLLQYGFGFEPASRDITFTFLVDGNEVEWSLGMAIAMHSAEQKMANESSEPTRNNNNTESLDEQGGTVFRLPAFFFGESS